MDHEDFLSIIYTPLKSIELLSETIYTKCNEDWELFHNKESAKYAQELLALNFAIKQITQYLLKKRRKSVDELTFPKSF